VFLLGYGHGPELEENGRLLDVILPSFRFDGDIKFRVFGSADWSIIERDAAHILHRVSAAVQYSESTRPS